MTTIKLQRGDDLTKDEIRRRLAQAYAFILSWQYKAADTADVSQVSTPGHVVKAQGTLYCGC
jgi:hypothetical protein